MKTVLLATQQTFMQKAEWIIGFVAVFLLPQLTAFIAVGTLVFFDMFTGLWCAIKSGTPITSKRMKDTITKLVMYNVLIITCMITEAYLITRIPFIEVGLGIIATVEAKSIFENIEKVLDIKILTAFKDVLHRGKSAKKVKEKKTT
jgi:hypothetical protein